MSPQRSFRQCTREDTPCMSRVFPRNTDGCPSTREPPWAFTSHSRERGKTLSVVRRHSGSTTIHVFRAINVAEPSLVRIEADEVTYNLHIMLRFEIEEALINSKVEVADLPELWNAKVKEYLGVDVPDDAHGVLQDVHWAGGLFGYFPSYMLCLLYTSP